ncbi:hypothetical protein [Pseudoneobacillus sp. C159]
MPIFLLLIGSFINSYLYIHWLPTPDHCTFYDFLLESVLNPIEVVASAFTFFLGFISNGIFLKNTIFSLKVKRNKNGPYHSFIPAILFMIIALFLLSIGFWQMVLFFSFSIVYGMMTNIKI